VTNKLVEVAAHSEAGNSQQVVAILRELHQRHETAAASLVHSDEMRQRITRKFQQLFQDCGHLCRAAIRRRELRMPERDAIAGLGERLSAPLVSAALAEAGLASEAVEATELVITDSCHGAAEPFMDLTRERCEARLHPLLLQGIVPVVTGFIGATVDGALTTLGRNSSDFSGTILGAALDADEVTLWTDVNGVLTADPRLVPEARSIREMSYREAFDLADLGAKVLHPKTLHPVMQRGIPLLIRNTFAPENLGTKITAIGSSITSAGVRALTATGNVALITLRRSSEMEVQEFLSRVMLAAANVPATVRLMPRSLATSEKLENCIVVDSALATSMVEALRREFAHELTTKDIDSIEIDPATAIVTVVGEGMRNMEELITRVLHALSCENLKVRASAQSASRSSVAFVVAHGDIQATLIALHRELQQELDFHT
jgi:aspartokinase/homoserine dehydrogenase 1